MMIKRKGKYAVSEKEPELLPFWYHCKCGGKAALSFEKSAESLFGVGSCLNCNREYRLNLGTEESLNLSFISDRISARAISMNLVFFKGLGVCCYVGGIGGQDYLTETRYIASRLNIPFPPIAFWRPHDTYLGIGQLEAILQYRRITENFDITKWENEVSCFIDRMEEIHSKINKLEAEKEELIRQLRQSDHAQKKNLQEKIIKISKKQGKIKSEENISVLNRDLKILKNIPVTLNLIPSIIDYAINVGLKETSKQWIIFLREDGNLFSDISMNSVLDDVPELGAFASLLKNFQ
jgi:hypothetical protein